MNIRLNTLIMLVAMLFAAQGTSISAQTENPYLVYPLYITTDDGGDIVSKEEYKTCQVSLDGKGSYADVNKAKGSVRCRGNSSFLWYPKKAYRIKFDKKTGMLGLSKAKSWVLLANYRDITDMMNTFVFAMGQALGLPFTNHTRYVELYVNDEYRGLYQLTEQVQQHKSRVNVSDERGILIQLDKDDGPELSPEACDNFWSEGYQMPVCVKYPDSESTANTIDSVKNVFGKLEKAIKVQNYSAVEKQLDIPSFIKYLQIQEFVYNVELDAPRSVYMHKDGDGKWFMGPLWDFDAGYDFNWGNMYGHDFFADYTELVMGTNPLRRNGNYPYMPRFFTDLFGCREFVQQYKEQWDACKDTIVAYAWNECMKHVGQLRSSGALKREAQRWPVAGKNFDTELKKMENWIENRLTHMNYVNAGIPLPVESSSNKKLYIPEEWRWSSGLYKESDPDGQYTWSKTRSMESANVIIFWDNGYTCNPKDLPKNDFYYVDMDDLLQKCEDFYELESTKLGFVDPETSNVAKYKMMVLMNHTTEWTCYGGGYDFVINALWLNPATCKPVGHSVAHEVGHSFHYMCYAEHSGHQNSSTDNTGFHLACGNGQTIWEQTAQWQAAQSYPELMYDQSIFVFRNSHNYAFSHEWHRYQSYWLHYFLCQYYNDIQTVAKVWNTPMTGQTNGKASDFSQALMKLKGLSVRDLYKIYFDYACHCVTWDIEACRPYRNPYIGDFGYRCVLTDNDEYQVTLASCPQGTGFNVIPLQVPQPGTVITTNLTGLNPASKLHDDDPGEYLNGDTQWTKLPADANGDRKYLVSKEGNASWRGFRMGYVALMGDGTRRYFSEDSIYCQGRGEKTEAYSFTVPEGVSRLWLVVSPALKSYITHRWDDKIEDDDMWPYRFNLQGTDISDAAQVYASATLDKRDVADITFTYDVIIPDNDNVVISLNGRLAAALGTAFQMQPMVLPSRMQQWDERGPANGKIMFYAANGDGSLQQSASTANGYGHWFDADGQVTSYANGILYSEFYPSAMSFVIGQYPGRCASGSTYTLRQTLLYKQNNKNSARANFVFHVTIGGTTASATLRSMEYNDPTGISDATRLNNKVEIINDNVYDLQGRRVENPSKGLYIVNGQKVVIK
jgi:hypothetical protein